MRENNDFWAFNLLRGHLMMVQGVLLCKAWWLLSIKDNIFNFLLTWLFFVQTPNGINFSFVVKAEQSLLIDKSFRLKMHFVRINEPCRIWRKCQLYHFNHDLDCIHTCFCKKAKSSIFPQFSAKLPFTSFIAWLFGYLNIIFGHWPIRTFSLEN